MQINPYDLKKREKKYPLGKIKAQLHTDGQGSIGEPEVCPMFSALQFKEAACSNLSARIGKNVLVRAHQIYLRC